MTDFEMISDAKDMAASIKTRLKTALCDIEMLEQVLSNYWDDEDQIAKSINKFMTSSETAFLKAKNIMQFYPKDFIETVPVNIKPWNVICKSGEYLFTLPPLTSKRNSKRAAADGKATKSVVKELCDGLEINEPFKKARIELTMYVNKTGASDAVPDFDNVDLKALLDAFQGRLIENDTALDYELVCRGIASDESKTTVLVREI